MFVFGKDMIFLSGSPFLIKKEPVKGVIYFKDQKMLEILLNALHRKDFVREGLASDTMFPFGNPVNGSVG